MEVVSDGLGDAPERLRRAGVVVHQLPLASKWSFAARVPQLTRLFKTRKPQLVHLHGQFAGSLGQVALALGRRPPTVYTVQWPSYLADRGPASRFRNRVAERLSCFRATAVVAVSRHDRNELLARHLCEVDKLTVIHNSYFVTPQVRRAIPAHDHPIVGFVGRLVDQKGCDVLLKAIPAILVAHPLTKFLIVGDGPERRRLEALCRDLRISSAVQFTGYDPSPGPRLRLMSLLAVPSIYEPLGMVALEAMACGVPVVASAVGGLPEAVDDGKTGVLVPPGDSSALAAAVIRVLGSRSWAAELGSAGRARADEHFSPTVVARKYSTLYLRLAAAASS